MLSRSSQSKRSDGLRLTISPRRWLATGGGKAIWKSRARSVRLAVSPLTRGVGRARLTFLLSPGERLLASPVEVFCVSEISRLMLKLSIEKRKSDDDRAARRKAFFEQNRAQLLEYYKERNKRVREKKQALLHPFEQRRARENAFMSQRGSSDYGEELKRFGSQ